MAYASFSIQLRVMPLRRADGLIVGVHLYAPKFVDAWYWLDREDDRLEELRQYRVGMFKGRADG